MRFNSYEDEHLGFLLFPIFFQVLHKTGNNLSALNQAFIKKHLGKLSSKSFPVGTRSKKSFLTSTTAVDTKKMLIIQSRLVVKPKNYSITIAMQKSLNQSA